MVFSFSIGDKARGALHRPPLWHGHGSGCGCGGRHGMGIRWWGGRDPPLGNEFPRSRWGRPAVLVAHELACPLVFVEHALGLCLALHEPAKVAHNLDGSGAVTYFNTACSAETDPRGVAPLDPSARLSSGRVCPAAASSSWAWLLRELRVYVCVGGWEKISNC